jgi:hypothetical protein
LTALDGEQLVDFVRRAERLLQGGDPIEWLRLRSSNLPIDRALYFLESFERGDGALHDALRRNQELCRAFQQWRKQANRTLLKDARPALRKAVEKSAVEKKLKALRRQAESKPADKSSA